MVCRHIKLCSSFEQLPLKGKGGVDFTAVGTRRDLARKGTIRLCHYGQLPCKGQNSWPWSGASDKGPSSQLSTQDTLQWTAIHNSDKRATFLRGTEWLPQHALYSEVPLCSACFYIRLSIVTLRTWSPGLCLLWMKACTHG